MLIYKDLEEEVMRQIESVIRGEVFFYRYYFDGVDWRWWNTGSLTNILDIEDYCTDIMVGGSYWCQSASRVFCIPARHVGKDIDLSKVREILDDVESREAG